MKFIFNIILFASHIFQDSSLEDDRHWYDKAKKSLIQAEINRGHKIVFCANAPNISSEFKKQPSRKWKAKNIILFIGDGMGSTTITAARILKGQKAGKPGEETEFVWDMFPNTAFAKTYSTNFQVPDSASTATAILCGVKTKFGVIGLNDSVSYENDENDSISKSRISCLSQWFIDQNKSVGVVTNTRITHATPAAFYAYATDRNYESDKLFVTQNHERVGHYMFEKKNLARKYKDIAWQLINNEPGNKFKVILGGGWKNFLTINEDNKDHAKLYTELNTLGLNISDLTEYKQKILRTISFNNNNDNETDAKRQGVRLQDNLIKRWLLAHNSKYHNAAYVTNRSQLLNINPDETDYLMGLFNHDHLNYEINRRKAKHGGKIFEPSLIDMSSKALDILSKDPNGYLLLIEGGRIDHGHHEGKARLALEETIMFEKTISHIYRKLKLLKALKNTLIVVTADHSHVLNMGGYPVRGNPILGLVQESKTKPYDLSFDGLPYTVLTYGNGPGAIFSNGSSLRPNLTNSETDDPNFQFPAAIPMREETHGGEDVPIYAIGPGSHLFFGVQEQSYIAHALAYATCVGPYMHVCERGCF